MASFLSNLIDNLAEGIRQIKSKYGHDNSCFEKILTHINTWMIGENSLKHHYQGKNVFTVT